MFAINDDLSIYATRGDIVFFGVQAEENGAVYKFQPGDVIRIKIYGKKAAESVYLEKLFAVEEETDTYIILLTSDDLKIGDITSKPTDYWYEIELNPFTNPQTIIGYDEDGPKIFKLFPEGGDVEHYEPDEEDIPFVDDELDPTSTRPIQNQAVTRALMGLIVGELPDTGYATEKWVEEKLAEYSGGNADFKIDNTLMLENGVLSVNTTNDMEQDNTLPITSAGVFATVGNIEALLKTI